MSIAIIAIVGLILASLVAVYSFVDGLRKQKTYYELKAVTPANREEVTKAVISDAFAALQRSEKENKFLKAEVARLKAKYGE
jgi:hypothetical protein